MTLLHPLRSAVPALAALLLLTAVAPALAREATVITKDGRELRGELAFQDNQSVVLVIAGIETPIPRKQIAEVQVQPTPEEVYREERPKLERDDLDGRYELAQRMYELKALEISRSELSDLARDFPSEPQVTRLLNVIDAELELQKQRSEGEARPTNRPPRPPRSPRPGAANDPADAPDLLTEEQINRIRVFQIDLRDEPRGVRFDMSALDDLFDQYRQELPERFRGSAGKRTFRGLEGFQQAELLFELQARDFYDKILISKDPKPLQTFRNRINPTYVARYFREQFGSGQLEGLQLVGSRPNGAPQAYTNFLLLQRYRTPGGLPLIDFTRPEESPLVQWGLPREQARFPAPELPGWKPYFRSIEDPAARTLIEWIGSLYEVQDYGIALPGDAPAQAPAAP